MMHIFHDWKWDKPVQHSIRETIQYATCTICGKTKAREVLA
ncbi:hypothetical protein [Microbacterium sp. KNMS]